MRVTRIISSAAIVIAAVACSHNKQEQAPSADSRIQPSNASNPARDTAAEYGNQGTRMGSPSDSSRREQTASTGASGASSTAGTAGQNDPNIIGSPAWWRTHLTADGKPRP
jgi:hypothetical protein